MRPTTRTWIALMLLSLLSVLAAGQAHHVPLWRLMATGLVAAVAWIKGQLLLRDYLESHRAGPVFHGWLQIFTALAPLGLIVCALREMWPD